MKKFRLTTAVLAALTLAAVACSKYDDSTLLNEIKNLKDKVNELENAASTPFELEMSDDDIVMFNNADSYRERTFEVPFTLNGATDGVIVTAVKNDIRSGNDGFSYGKNLVQNYKGNSVEVVMETATSGKLVVTQELSRIIFSDEEFYAHYDASDISVIATDKDGRTSIKKIHLGYEIIWGDYLDMNEDNYEYECVNGRPTYTIPAGASAFSTTVDLHFNIEGIDFDCETSAAWENTSNLFWGNMFGFNAKDTIEANMAKTTNGIRVQVTFGFAKNNSGTTKETYCGVYKCTHVTGGSRGGNYLYHFVVVQE